jgi:hypothetical protein
MLDLWAEGLVIYKFLPLEILSRDSLLLLLFNFILGGNYCLSKDFIYIKCVGHNLKDLHHCHVCNHCLVKVFHAEFISMIMICHMHIANGSLVNTIKLKVLHAEFISMVMICHMHIANGSLVNTIKLKHKLHSAAMFLFCILHKITITKAIYFFWTSIMIHNSIQN